MKLVLIFLTTLSFTLGWYPDCGKSKYTDAGGMPLPVLNIVGGEETRPNEFPWQVSLKSGSFQFCGGSIINDKWILTAAHCVKKVPRSLVVVTGEHYNTEITAEENIYSVQKVIVHPRYQRGTKNSNDIALLKVNGVMSLNENAWPVCAPEDNNDYVHVKAVVSGWGALKSGGSASNGLRYTTVNTTSNKDCNKYYAYRITDDMICASDNRQSTVRDSCQGDSGGPLVTKKDDGTYKLIGIVSWGAGCASGYPGVYVRVNYFTSWILSTMQNN